MRLSFPSFESGIKQSIIDAINSVYTLVNGNMDENNLVNNTSFSVYKGGVTQSIINATWVKVTFDIEKYDKNGWFASDRYTPKVSGIYRFSSSVEYGDPLMDKLFRVAIYKNGVLANEAREVFSTGDWPTPNISVELEVNGTSDYFEVYSYHNKGSAATILNNSPTTYFMGSRVS